MKDNFYVSSIAFKGYSVPEMIQICNQNNLNLEFSSGLPHIAEMETLYLDASIRKMPHNYFPAPEVPFVINLASQDEKIRRNSIDHCIASLKLAKKSNAPFYAAHAGFCFDPEPWQLGNEIFVGEYNREKSRSLFVDSVREVLEVANHLNIDFLIENNVLSPFIYKDDIIPLLCCESKEITWLMETINNPRLGILLDTAHLKVSCKTLNKDLLQEFRLISPFIKGFHHSDNNGYEDMSDPLEKDYWFKQFGSEFKNHVHVLEVKNLILKQIRQQLEFLTNTLEDPSPETETN